MVFAGGGTGGHLYPALVLADAVRRLSGDEVDTLLIGAERGIEARVLPEAGVPHRLLPLEPIYRSRPWRNWRLLPSALRSVREIHRLYRSIGPRLVVGTGGYASGPAVAWALLTRTRTAIQEQNSYPGLTTRWLAPFVDQLHLGYPEALSHLNPGSDTRIRTHGNPIRWPASRPDPGAARDALELPEGRLVLVVGGSQGAAAINRALLEALSGVATGALPGLPGDVTLLWSTGPKHHASVSERLAELAVGPAVRPVPYIDAMQEALSLTALAISRAGALALAELCGWGVPALLVPYPHAAGDHQRGNARALEAEGAAVVLEERVIEEEPAALWRGLLELLETPGRLSAMSDAARARGNPEAADRIAADLLELWRAV